MLFSWLKRRRRARVLAEPMPPEWTEVLDAIAHVANLAPDARLRLDDRVRIFVAEMTFFGHSGLEVTDPMRVTIAGLASVLTVGWPEFHYDHVDTVILHPTPFTLPQRTSIAMGAALEEEVEHLGAAYRRGPVVLAWEEIEEDLREPWCGRNLVFHEFAHQLDMLNGDMDGVPNLTPAAAQRWATVMAREYRHLTRAARRRRQTFLDPYGATDPAEFFAVATETFFDAPQDLLAERPQLYEIMRDYFCQDPANA